MHTKRLVILYILLMALTLTAQAGDGSRQPAPAPRAGDVRAVGGGGVPLTSIRDGSLEDATSEMSYLVSPDWTAEATVFTTPICSTALCGTGGGTAGPNTGANWVWFGGLSAAESAWIEQQIVIPDVDGIFLLFEYWVGTHEHSPTPTVFLLIDGMSVWSPPLAATIGYEGQSVDLTPFADGEAHTIHFGYSQSAGTGITNISIDDISLYKGEGHGFGDTGFELNDGSWTVKNGVGDKQKCNKPDKNFSYVENCAFRFKGGVGENSKISQSVEYAPLRVPPPPGRAPSALLNYAGAFISGSAGTSGKLILKLKFNDDSKDKAATALGPTTGYEWVQTEPMSFTIEKYVVKVKVIFKNKSISGKWYIDAVEAYDLGVYF